MITPSIVTRQILARELAERWRSCAAFPAKKVQVLALGPDPDPAALEALFPGAHALRLSCSTCDQEVDRAVTVGTGSEDEYGPALICGPCLVRCLSLLGDL